MSTDLAACIWRRTPTASNQRGFTLIELVIVVTLLGLLAAAALPRMLNVTTRAESASLEMTAGSFSSAANLAHTQWMALGNSRGSLTDAGNKVLLNFDGRRVYLNEFGWPANTTVNADSGAANQTADECRELFLGMLQNPPTATTNVAQRDKARFFVSVQSGAASDDFGNRGDLCRYELIVNSATSNAPTHYFDYNLVRGDISTTTPGRN